MVLAPNTIQHTGGKSPKKVLFYCQHLVGVGHLTRSIAICNELARAFSVTLIQGGPDIGKKPKPEVRVLALPPFMMDAEEKNLIDPVGNSTPEEIFARRWIALAEELESPYDYIFVELFPFGRKKLRGEILQLIEGAKAVNPNAKVICSLRDIMVEKNDFLTRDKKTADTVNQYFDYVCVHSDPNLVRLEETFSQAEAITDKVVYTGYVTEGDGQNIQAAPERKKRILISQGGGIVGAELLLAVARIVGFFPDYHFDFITGPNAPKEIHSEAARILAAASNARLLPFLHNFEAELARSSLSISLAGYNTVMNLLSTRTPALVYPYAANHEQMLRSRKLENLGILKVITEADLAPERLVSYIRKALTEGASTASFNLQGAGHTAAFLGSLGTTSSLNHKSL